MSKLTLSIDSEVVERAKEYARQHGVSVSEMVEGYLAFVTRPPKHPASAPLLEALRGILKNVEVDDYRRHLERKYR